MYLSSIPSLSFFLSKVTSVENLIPALSAYLELLQDELRQIEIYENPMLYVEKIDFYEHISTFLDLLQNERERIEKSEAEGKNIAGADENGSENK